MPTLDALGFGNEMFAYAYTEGRRVDYHVRQIAGGSLHSICDAASPERLRGKIRTHVFEGVIYPDTQIIRDTMRIFVIETLIGAEEQELNEELAKYRALTGQELLRAGMIDRVPYEVATPVKVEEIIFPQNSQEETTKDLRLHQKVFEFLRRLIGKLPFLTIK